MKILFLDTESTGLPLWREPSSDPRQPHIVDLACELRDSDTMELLGELDCIINPGVPIPPEVSAIHGITDEIARGGRDPTDALTDFFALVDQADKIVAHNVDFDTRMVRIQAQRIWNREWVAPVPTFCTMRATTNLCRIPKANGRGPRDYKWPKLTEALKFLFDEELPDAHRAKPDMIACRRIYFHLNPPVAPIAEPKADPVAPPTAIYVQFSDCGQHIRKWAREPFDGAISYGAAT